MYGSNTDSFTYYRYIVKFLFVYKNNRWQLLKHKASEGELNHCTSNNSNLLLLNIRSGRIIIYIDLK